MSIYELSLIATVIMALAALASAVAAAMSARTAKRALAAQTEPEVIVFMDGSPNESDAATLYVRNIGSAPAYGVSIEIDPGLPCDEDAKEGVELGFLSDGIPFLQPGGVRKVFLGLFDEQIRKMGDTVYEAKVACFSAPLQEGGRMIVGRYPISGLSFVGDTYDDPKEVVYMKEMASSLEKMSKRLK